MSNIGDEREPTHCGVDVFFDQLDVNRAGHLVAHEIDHLP
jgi:hypothetical protein